MNAPDSTLSLTERTIAMADQKEEQAQQQAQQPEVVLNEKGAHAAYANFARVTATPEEVIIDFALNPNPFLAGKQDIQVSQRLIVNFFTAKRLWIALGQTIQRHEATYGSVELDVTRRAHPSAFTPGGRQ